MALRRTLEPFFGKSSQALVEQANQASKLLNTPGLPLEQAEQLMVRIKELLQAAKDLMLNRKERSLKLQSINHRR